MKIVKEFVQRKHFFFFFLSCCSVQGLKILAVHSLMSYFGFPPKPCKPLWNQTHESADQREVDFCCSTIRPRWSEELMVWAHVKQPEITKGKHRVSSSESSRQILWWGEFWETPRFSTFGVHATVIPSSWEWAELGLLWDFIPVTRLHIWPWQREFADVIKVTIQLPLSSATGKLSCVDLIH
jgi:hypothetical protein